MNTQYAEGRIEAYWPYRPTNSTTVSHTLYRVHSNRRSKSRTQHHTRVAPTMKNQTHFTKYTESNYRAMFGVVGGCLLGEPTDNRTARCPPTPE